MTSECDPLLTNTRSDLIRDVTALESLKIDLTSALAINALYWAFLSSQGVTPKTNAVKTEIDRIKTYMGKVKMIEDKKKAPRLGKLAAKRFVTHSLWDLEKAKRQKKTAAKSPKPKKSSSGGNDVITISDGEAKDDDVILVDDDMHVKSAHVGKKKDKKQRKREKKERKRKFQRITEENCL